MLFKFGLRRLRQLKNIPHLRYYWTPSHYPPSHVWHLTHRFTEVEPACRRIRPATAGKRFVTVRSRGKTLIESIARRQDGSRRPFGFSGPVDPLSYQSRSIG